MDGHHINLHIHSRDISVRVFMAGLQHDSFLADLSKERLVIVATSLHLDLENMTEAVLAPPNQQVLTREPPQYLLTR